MHVVEPSPPAPVPLQRIAVVPFIHAGYWPAVDVIMIDSRGKNWPALVQEAVASISGQVYPGDLGFIPVPNFDRAFTIGACWNAAVRSSTAPLVFFVGDDDRLMPDCVLQHVVWYLTNKRNRSSERVPFHAVTSGCLTLREDGRPIAPMAINHTGLFERDYLVDHPFNALAPKHVDTDMHNRMFSTDPERTRILTMPHYFGYGYRQHPWQVSGQKVVFTRKGQALPRL